MFKISEGAPIYYIIRTIHDEHGRPCELLIRKANPLRVHLVERGLRLS